MKTVKTPPLMLTVTDLKLIAQKEVSYILQCTHGVPMWTVPSVPVLVSTENIQSSRRKSL